MTRDADRPHLPPWLRSSFLGWAGTVLAALVVALAASIVLHEKRAVEASEFQSAALYARVLQDHAERTFNTIDIALGSLADGMSMPGNGPAQRTHDLIQAQQGLPFLRSLSLMTAEGRILASSSPANVGVVVDLLAIPLPAPGAVDRLGSSLIGRDLSDVTASPTARPGASRTFVPLVRALAPDSGQPLFLVAVINPDFFANEYELALADPTRSAAILAIDGTMWAATGPIETLPGQSMAAHRFFADYLPSQESGSFIGPGMNGDKVVTAFRVLRKRPVVVIVERRYAHVLAGLRQTALWMAGLCAGVLAILGVMMVMAWRSLSGHEAVRTTLEATRKNIAASERDLRVMVESVHELIFRVDATGRIVFVNGRWQALTGRPASDVVGKRLTDLCREDEREACYEMFLRLQTHDDTMLVHVADAAGRSLTLDLSVSRLLDAGQRVVGFAGFAVDVSAREAAQQALQAQLKFTAQLIELSPTPVFVKDEQGCFVAVNRAWLELMNLTLPDALGRDSADLFGDDAAKHRDHDASLLQAQERVSYENRLVVPGRLPRDTVVTKVRFTRADGTPAGIVGSIVDVTEFREAERDIRKARDAAQRANDAKSEFIANISHELRTPLQGIIGFAELGRSAASGPMELLDMFNDIHAGGQRMLALVNGLLDVSQMDSAVGSLPLRTVDIAEVARNAITQLVPEAQARDLRFNLQGLTDGVLGDIDPERFQQAVRHVLSNAVRYSPEGGRIEVTLADRGLAGTALSIKDAGPGIPEDELERVFEAFVQSSRTRDGSGGTGLGLTIARKIMGAHGGSVVAANAPDGGALVSLLLPAADKGARASGGTSSSDATSLRFASEVN